MNREVHVLVLREAGGFRRPTHPPGKARTRPLGIPTVADRLLQKAVARILEAVFEADFCDVSYGYRPGRRKSSESHRPELVVSDIWVSPDARRQDRLKALPVATYAHARAIGVTRLIVTALCGNEIAAAAYEFAAGIELRHDHGSKYISDDFQQEIEF